MVMKCWVVLLVLVLLEGSSLLYGQPRYLDSWPKGDSPQEVGKLLAEHFATSPHQYATGTLHYSEVVTWYGALTFARKTHDTALTDELVAKFAPLMPGGSEDARIPKRRHVDDSVFGVVPLEIGIDTGDKRYLEYGTAWADRQWDAPLRDGLTAESRFWVDDMYMITLLQVEAYRATGDSKYLNRASREIVAYLMKLQTSNGLFFHTNDAPIYWARGDGWAAAGMAELLLSMPADHPQRPLVLQGYRKMMSALLRYQGNDGMWRQVIDNDEAWPETSGSAMFSFAMISGVQNGWLVGDQYAHAARKAWIALIGYIDQNEDVTNVCEGTNKKNDMSYYLARRRRTGDFHGQAAMLWTASALLR